MPDQKIDFSDDNIALITQRLDNAQGGRKKSNSIASLVERVRAKIEAARARGLTWRAIAFAILEDETQQAAIRSAYQRLPPKAPDSGNRTCARKTRAKAVTAPAQREAQAHERLAKTKLFSLAPITDDHASDNN